MLAKMDIKQAYRNVPVHPADRRAGAGGCSTTLRSPINTSDLYGSRRCGAVDHDTKGDR